jgi:Rv0078B-related antitoxin
MSRPSQTLRSPIDFVFPRCQSLRGQVRSKTKLWIERECGLSIAPVDKPNEFQPLMDDIFREKVLRARRQSPESKFELGIELFEVAIVRMRGGIRSQFPEFTPEQVEQELRRRLARVRQIQEHGFYTNLPPA